MTVDVHQHLWPEPFLAALRARRTPPRLDGWDAAAARRAAVRGRPGAPRPRRARRRPTRRRRARARRAVGRARPRPAPAAESAELADAWLEGALALPAPFRAWADGRHRRARPGGAARRAGPRRGRARGRRRRARRPGRPRPRSRRCSTCSRRRGRPLLVHPGPAGAADAPGRPAGGRPSSPTSRSCTPPGGRGPTAAASASRALPVCFVALAGLGPLHGERHRARGGDGRAVDPLTFVETSSYGTQAVDAVVRVLGIDVVCHGSDRPYAAPPRLGARRRRAARHPHRQPRAPARPRPPGGVRMTADASAVLRALGLPGDRPLERPELERLAGALAGAPRAVASRTSTCARPSAPTRACTATRSSTCGRSSGCRRTTRAGTTTTRRAARCTSSTGALEEHALLVAAPERRTRYAAGQRRSRSARRTSTALTCAAPRAVSIHAYSPAALAARPVHASTPTVRCTGSRCPTPTSCARSTRTLPAAA